MAYVRDLEGGDVVEAKRPRPRRWPLFYSTAVLFCLGASSLLRFVNGRQASNSHVELPQIGQRSGAAARLAP